MATRTNSGFTIIETLLYLGVSSALVVAILMGVGSAVTKQRYSDSVDSLKSQLQEQYGAVANTVNNREGLESCGVVDGKITLNNAAAPGVAQRPGASECVIIGRYIESNTTAGGGQLLISDVIAYPKLGLGGGSSVDDISDLKDNYYLQRGTYERARYELPWGARIVKSSTALELMDFSMMIVRSPRSGGVMTFSAPATAPDSLISTGGLVSPTSNGRTLDLCVDGDRGLGVGAKLRQVRVAPYATSASGVQIPNEGDSICG